MNLPSKLTRTSPTPSAHNASKWQRSTQARWASIARRPQLTGAVEPCPRELAFLHLDGIQRRVPADAARRTLIALDCGSALRIDRRGEVAGQFARVVNIDHHHANTLFGAHTLA